MAHGTVRAIVARTQAGLALRPQPPGLRERLNGGLQLAAEPVSLLADPIGTLTPLFETLGIDASARVVERVVAHAQTSSDAFADTHRTAPSPEASVGRPAVR